jgi:hypothetical protein
MTFATACERERERERERESREEARGLVVKRNFIKFSCEYACNNTMRTNIASKPELIQQQHINESRK